MKTAKLILFGLFATMSSTAIAHSGVHGAETGMAHLITHPAHLALIGLAIGVGFLITRGRKNHRAGNRCIGKPPKGGAS